MAKMCLVTFSGQITQIVDEGQEFEIYDGPDAKFRWMLCEDDAVGPLWYVNKGVFIQREAPPVDLARQRAIAYGDVGAQLDMIYHDQQNGTTTWQDHVANVKTTYPAPSTVQGGVQDPIVLSTEDNPAWNVE